MGIYLYKELEFGGQQFAFPMPAMAELPLEIRFQMKSLKVYPGHAPVAFFEFPNYKGKRFLVGEAPTFIGDLGEWAGRLNSFSTSGYYPADE
ncbi:hypothetical protein FQ775_24015 [Nitratireductor mangrovi]|uniref:Uncharacterized protein n=1 Tax=Nitratireductor mangrovi TaxID=2599600 RepID=A0A6H0DX75_9HYPH|nr:hypothetical protein [Nitratireductor mangrovi]QIS94670.1 hypothetical protein FQ775_24015 [Nitratireductor mangrovi]